MSRTQDIYGEPEIFIRKNGVDRVYRPIGLTNEERAKRMKIIHDAWAALIINTEHRKRRKKNETVNA